MSKKLIIIGVLLGLLLVVPAVVRAQVVVEKSTEIVTISNKQYYMHHVKQGETLYSIARVYEISQEEILRLNPEINDLGLQADMVIGIPVVSQQQEEQPVVPPVVTPEVTLEDGDEYGDGYIIHTVKESERTRRLIRRYDVDSDEFHRLNPTVGSRVFVGQKVLIPCKGATSQQHTEPVIEPDTVTIQPVVPVGDTVVEEILTGPYVLPKERPDWCYASHENKNRDYRVALLVPLYLNDIDKLETSKDKAEKTKNTRAMKFLQYYEGFMMAVDSLTKNYGLRLDLTVIDVHENTATAHDAVSQLEHRPVDIIIGPFFSKSFAVVQDYASRNDIMIVNPLSERESIILNAPNVVKLKSSPMAMAEELSDLIKVRYPKAKVTLVSDGELADTAMVRDLERVLDTTVKTDVMMSNAEMLELIAQESLRRKMGKRMLSTLEVEGQIFSTKALSEHPDGEIYFENHFQHLSYEETETFKKELSSARENVLVAYGKDIVFSTKILNSINKSAQKFPITLIGLPSWKKFDNLLVPNLLNMNAIYFDDHFVDYNDSVVLKFVDDFRLKYESEPMDYAFEGFDVGWYFLSALMEFGPRPMECLPYYHIPLLHTRYYFNKRRYEDGLENRYWNIYQYDSQSVELKPIRIYEEDTNE
ncbi:MAG: LysM peptidoglycan-binding domain-containing protein [Bacteroidales bacterium]|nr:LysM peptidoglycan-binding domain-containing protein [Bacteroidales bacterium]